MRPLDISNYALSTLFYMYTFNLEEAHIWNNTWIKQGEISNAYVRALIYPDNLAHVGVNWAVFIHWVISMQQTTVGTDKANSSILHFNGRGYLDNKNYHMVPNATYHF